MAAWLGVSGRMVGRTLSAWDVFGWDGFRQDMPGVIQVIYKVESGGKLMRKRRNQLEGVQAGFVSE